MASDVALHADFLIIGGGIAGTTCAEYISHADPRSNVVLIAASDVIKSAVTAKKHSALLEEIRVTEEQASQHVERFQNVSVLIGYVVGVDAAAHVVSLADDRKVSYKKLCVCTGARPNLISNNPHVIGIRDTDTVRTLSEKLATANRVAVLGNGGIALELVYEIECCDVVWCVKNNYIGNTFLDEGASEFMMSSLKKKDKSNRKVDQLVFKRRKYMMDRDFLQTDSSTSAAMGTALGPDWSEQQTLSGGNRKQAQIGSSRHIEYECECTNLFSHDELSVDKSITRLNDERDDRKWNVYMELSNGRIFGCDFIISATGVQPYIPFDLPCDDDTNAVRSADGGLFVDSSMRTRVPDIYAAGDCCSPDTNWGESATSQPPTQPFSSHSSDTNWGESTTSQPPTQPFSSHSSDTNWGESATSQPPTQPFSSHSLDTNWSESATPHPPTKPLWFHMRLWTQAWQMGAFAGKCMAAHAMGDVAPPLDFCFELFAHATTFFGFKVCLLGLYNAQGLDNGSYEFLLRTTPEEEYIKVVVQGGRVKGAVLVGETDLEETIENLILNEMDVSAFGESLLDPDIDIEDYFD